MDQLLSQLLRDTLANANCCSPLQSLGTSNTSNMSNLGFCTPELKLLCTLCVGRGSTLRLDLFLCSIAYSEVKPLPVNIDSSLQIQMVLCMDLTTICSSCCDCQLSQHLPLWTAYLHLQAMPIGSVLITTCSIQKFAVDAPWHLPISP